MNSHINKQFDDAESADNFFLLRVPKGDEERVPWELKRGAIIAILKSPVEWVGILCVRMFYCYRGEEAPCSFSLTLAGI